MATIYYKFDKHNEDNILIKLKNSVRCTNEEASEYFNENGKWRYYNSYHENGEIKYGVYTIENFGDTPEVIKDIPEKIEYLFQCSINDSELANEINEAIPSIKEFRDIVEENRKKCFTKYFFEKMGITVEDFLLDTGYIIITNEKIFNELDDAGLLDWDNFEFVVSLKNCWTQENGWEE